MNFVDILKEYHISIAPEGHQHGRGGWVNFDCPFCEKDSHKYHMGYNISYNYVNCWKCGTHYLLDTLIELTGLSVGECRKLLSGLETKRITKVDKGRGKLIIPFGVHRLIDAHHRYLQKRGYQSLDLATLWKLQGIGIAGNLSWRIFIPIYYHSEMVSWTTRSISDSPNVTRYISASTEQESISHKELLYGEDYARDTIIICEGCFDVWKIGVGAVATLGTGYSKAQVLKMIEHRNRYICFDNEPEAQRRAWGLCNILSLYPGKTSNIKLDSKDAGEAADKEIKYLKGLLT